MVFKVLLLLASIYCCEGKPQLPLPVFMMDYDNVMSHLTIIPDPFTKITNEAFSEIVLDASRRTECIILFVEETFCVEDISSKDKLGTPYYNLQRGLLDHKVSYIPGVKKPTEMLNQIFVPLDSNSYRLDSILKLKLENVFKYIYISFENIPNAPRITNLRKHDTIMKEVYFAVRQVQTGPIVGFYTGKYNPVTIASLEVPRAPRGMYPKDSGVLVTTKDALFRLKGVFTSTPTRRSMLNRAPVVDYETRSRRALSTTMQYADLQLQFNFDFRETDWAISNVILLEAGEEVGRTNMRVGAPWNHSYYCAEPITVVNLRDGSSITLSEYQIQPVFRSDVVDPQHYMYPRTSSLNEEGENERGFDTAINCGPYFNSVILAGLTLTALFLCITTWGVLMLFNCETNSRFDDPNAKTITVVQEVG